nr:MAG TPA: hypothetical protein [Caudoviricetes sp.]
MAWVTTNKRLHKLNTFEFCVRPFPLVNARVYLTLRGSGDRGRLCR